MDGLADHELRNWSRWCNQGNTILPWGISVVVLFDENTAPDPINEGNAKRVQSIYDAAEETEKKVLQAEYVSPHKYKRTVSVEAAARALKISTPSYEILLASMKRRVEEMFR
ncbi:hypothetical protein [Burkholderia pseudomallei]|uniref:hypothetical protein n=1 Tax=Burkholderia pseudomallei TaxID=28450 RepID=UPI00097664BB|nr:hypothetical protein [Burkholderia pseudomallei]OMQ57090.1 hypothetical protein AQ709_26690 [Burkholderia pseudomallei]OMQ65156.1 hypothetical protein AQ712_13100 [Burkholderia pseudomallei]OMQ72887.1 hypothetical protein AQ711_02560 [Burkholderia pseudomallei]CAJ2716318.1 Uncharacterised protein [Burkholderia pseudomallei]CAJ4670111.1 Uncharacterised protein [Burkholderia pseudomallei]